MRHFIWIYCVCKFSYFHFWHVEVLPWLQQTNSPIVKTGTNTPAGIGNVLHTAAIQNCNISSDMIITTCTTILRYPIFSMRYTIVCKVNTGYRSTSEIDHGLCTCTVDNPLAKAWRLSLLTEAQTMLYLSHIQFCMCCSLEI